MATLPTLANTRKASASLSSPLSTTCSLWMATYWPRCVVSSWGKRRWNAWYSRAHLVRGGGDRSTTGAGRGIGSLTATPPRARVRDSLSIIPPFTRLHVLRRPNLLHLALRQQRLVLIPAHRRLTGLDLLHRDA